MVEEYVEVVYVEVDEESGATVSANGKGHPVTRVAIGAA